jgi:molybdate transport system substrate-binding protein
MRKFKMRKVVALWLVLFMVSLLGGCAAKTAPEQTTVEPVEITVFAAASLQDAAQELKTAYESKHKESKITYNFASSGKLQKQIEEGAPSDLFISAGKSQMDTLEKQALIDKDSRLNLLGNKLVLIAPSDSTLKDFNGLLDASVSKIAIGEPETVPAGKYGREVLQSLKLWDGVQSKLVFTNNVRQVLTYVESGNVEAGLVYKSDLYGSEKAKEIAPAPADSHSPIVYPAAVVSDSKQKEAAADFLAFLCTPEAGQIFSKYGFDPLAKQ